MLILILLNVVGLLLSWLFSWLPVVTTLPFGMDYAFSLGVGYFKTVSELFPPLGLLLEFAMYYFSFKLVLLVLKIFKVFRV